LINLTRLYLDGNQITDIFPLVENTGLGSGDQLFLDYIPLSQEALDIHIPILEDRNFDVLIYSSTPNNYAACYPNPSRNEIGVTPNTDLEWRGNFPTREANYDVWLRETNSNLENVGNGIAINDTLYSFTPNLDENTNYWWKVRAFTDTDTIWSGLWHFTTGYGSGIEIGINPIETNLYGNYPNPFNPTTTIEFSIQNDSQIDLSIYNIKGQKIANLINEQLQIGGHSIIWDGTDDSGKPVSSGIYYYKLDVNGKTESVRKCLLLK